MTITKPTLVFNKKITRTTDLVVRVSYINIEGAEKLTSFNKTLAENLLLECENFAARLADDNNKTAVVLLEPTVTYFDDDIISAKYDFTVTESGEILFHRRFCLNYLLKYDLFLLPQLLRCGGKRPKADEFYLTRVDGGVGVVKLKSRSVRVGERIARRAQLDTLCDGEVKSAKIKLPHFLDSAALRKKSKNKGTSD